MELVKRFDELSRTDTQIAGGKGASLGEMTRAGISVPPGFVILSSCFERFVQQAGLKEAISDRIGSVRRDGAASIEKASFCIRKSILDARMPEEIGDAIRARYEMLDARYVAVRSSATAEDGSAHAWAGQLESYLNTTEANLLERVKRCWSSLYTPRSIFYRLDNGLLEADIAVAAIVQEMVESEISGVAFSVHPVSENHDNLLIEAAYGLGEAVVSGQVTPDSYMVDKASLKVINARIGRQQQQLVRGRGDANEWIDVPPSAAGAQKLSRAEITELARLVMRVEERFGVPVDVEWARADGRFSILQSRPITTLENEEKTYSFEGIAMVSRGRRLAYQHEASLKVLAQSKVWRNELGIGYKVAIMNALGDYYVDKESAREVDAFFEKRDFAFAEAYGTMLAACRDSLTRAIEEDPEADLTDGFSKLFAYFFIVRSVFEKIYAHASPGDQQAIEQWRNDSSFFVPLECYYAKHPEKDRKSEEEWSWVYRDGVIELHKENIIFGGQVPEASALFNTEEIRGNPAYPGVVRGKVRLILTAEDKNLVKEGEIIVAPVTTVDFLPIMKKAAAFVTDEGGITSHAAIVAREMRKPCIIGTRFASHVLKNGDMIEVDADTGVVRIVT